MCKCAPIPDKPKSTTLPDDNFEKVPHTNLAICHSLLATATLKWLTLFTIHSSTTCIRSTYFLMSGYVLGSKHWQFDLVHDTLNWLRNLSTCHPQCRLIQSELDVL